MNPLLLLTAALRHPEAGGRCHPADAKSTRLLRPPKLSTSIRGSFAPPSGTLELGVGRQPNGYTCGTETFLAICEFLRLPLRTPDVKTIEDFSKDLTTSAKYGTDPQDLVDVAKGYLRIGARVANRMTIDELAGIANRGQPYVEALLRGAPIDGPLELAVVSYQAYVDDDRKKSWFYPHGRKRALRSGKARLNPVRTSRGILWRNDWSDGHWSAVLRVIRANERPLLRAIGAHLDRDVLSGIVILGDPSNGEGWSFVPLPEFEERWHDTDRHDDPRFEHMAVVFHVSPSKLQAMRTAAMRQAVPMFAMTTRNAVLYVP